MRSSRTAPEHKAGGPPHQVQAVPQRGVGTQGTGSPAGPRTAPPTAADEAGTRPRPSPTSLAKPAGIPHPLAAKESSLNARADDNEGEDGGRPSELGAEGRGKERKAKGLKRKRRSAEEASAQPSDGNVRDVLPEGDVARHRRSQADAGDGSGPAGGGTGVPQTPGTKVMARLPQTPGTRLMSVPSLFIVFAVCSVYCCLLFVSCDVVALISRVCSHSPSEHLLFAPPSSLASP